MGQVDDLQNAEEFVDQMREEEARRDQEALAAEFAEAPLADTAGRGRRTELIPIADIGTGFNIRRELKGIEPLARSIHQRGLHTPLEVRVGGDGESPFMLISGHRRLKALQLIDPAGALEARCEVVEDIDEAEHFVLQLIENDHDELEPKDQARGVRLLLDKYPDWDAKTLAQSIGKDVAWARRHLRLLELPEPVREKLEAGDLTFTAADLLRKGRDKGEIDEAEMEKLAEQSAAGEITTADLREKTGHGPPAPPEGYEELSRQLDESRREQLYGPKGQREREESLEEAADALLGAAPWEPAPGDESETVFSSADQRPVEEPGKLDPRQREGWVEQISDQLADAHLLGLLLSRYMADAYLDELGTSRSDVYKYALELDEAERKRMLRDASRTILAASPKPPQTILKAAGVKR